MVSQVSPPTCMVTHIMLGFAMLGYFFNQIHWWVGKWKPSFNYK